MTIVVKMILPFRWQTYILERMRFLLYQFWKVAGRCVFFVDMEAPRCHQAQASWGSRSDRCLRDRCTHRSHKSCLLLSAPPSHPLEDPQAPSPSAPSIPPEFREANTPAPRIHPSVQVFKQKDKKSLVKSDPCSSRSRGKADYTGFAMAHWIKDFSR